MTKYNVDVIDIAVTEWNEEYQDWSGDTFFKGGFHLGNADSNKLDDVLATVNTMFDISKYGSEINEDGQLIFTVIEDEYAMQDDNGHYLVDYLVEVEEVKNVIIEE
ncbi:hypothetical protein YN120080_201 [Staphylococcus phage vB_SauM_JDYN]|nr:hypothetical protein YN120080_201 [Staphylococcus phage vB_SauM_JDYN]